MGLGLPASSAWLVKGEAQAVSRMLEIVLKISSKYPAIKIGEARSGAFWQVSSGKFEECGGNVKSQPEAVIEHLVGRQGRPRAAQLYAMHLSDWEGWSQDPPLPRPHLKVCSGGKGISLEIPAYLRPSKGKQIFFLSFCIHSCYV